MAVSSLKVEVSTPVERISRGRGFYQLEEDELYLPIIHSPEKRERFFSYLDSENVSLHLDRSGRLIFIELFLPRRRWPVKENLVPPEKADPADIRFLDFRENFPNPTVFSDIDRGRLMICLRRKSAKFNYFLAENIIAQVDSDRRLTAIWVSDIIDDLAGQEISAWRKSIYRVKPSRQTHRSHSIRM
jgi:hypothetical protein